MRCSPLLLDIFGRLTSEQYIEIHTYLTARIKEDDINNIVVQEYVPLPCPLTAPRRFGISIRS